MLNGNRILALIPARGGSKGIPGKNVKDLKGKPLIAHTILAAKHCGYIDRIIVSTDSEEIAETAKNYGAEVPFLRPESLAMDTSKTIDAIIYTVRRLEEAGDYFDYLVLLQPTSPLRSAEDIKAALERAAKSGRDVAAVSPVADSPILIRECDKENNLQPLLATASTVRRQDMPEYFRVNGSIYVNRICDLTSETSLNDNPVGYCMPLERSVDIDEKIDFIIAEYYLQNGDKENES